MPLRIENESMSLEVDSHIVATAVFREHAAADGHGAWVVSDRPGRLFSRDQAITALTVTELLKIGHSSIIPGIGRLAAGVIIEIGVDVR
jgi:hypothetical protein